VKILKQFLEVELMKSERTTRETRMGDIEEKAAEIMVKVRAVKPLVHHITNFVVMNETANITLCTGARPVMAHAKEEVEEMVDAANALVLNIGTLWPEQVESMIMAGLQANKRGVPIILDPVGAGATRFRTDSTRRLLGKLSIAVARGNPAEISVMAGYKAEIRGVDSSGVVYDTAEVAMKFAREYGCVAAVTGPVDVVTDGIRVVHISNGHPIMSSVTGTGCMATSVVAAYAAVEKDSVIAATAALAALGLAGEMAAQNAHGPGTFHVNLYDALAGLTEDSLRTGARIKVTSR
jgi:hydroxyethylthiazole kinase